MPKKCKPRLWHFGIRRLLFIFFFSLTLWERHISKLKYSFNRFFLSFFKFYFIFKLYIIVLALPNIKMNQQIFNLGGGQSVHFGKPRLRMLLFGGIWTLLKSINYSAHDKGHEEGGSAYAKAGWSFRSPPGNSRAYTPKTRVCLLSACAFT